MRRAVLVILALAVLAARTDSQSFSIDSGAAEAWQKINKLRTTVSVMHITAHPDDEDGGVLAKLSRGDGARVTLLTLNRGESGDNAIGPQLFDALGLIRTEELLAAGRYYGIDQQYFTTLVDYGFSKTLEESMSQWGRETVLRDVVRIIRMERPTILLSRFQGNERDGHGNHQAAGLMAQEAFRAAGDPSRFPEQLKDGLRPWQPKKLYIGVRDPGDSVVEIKDYEYSPVLGSTFVDFARQGLRLQRSQNSGRAGGPGRAIYYKRVDRAASERSIFAGLPSTLADLIGARGKAIDTAIAAAMAAFKISAPSASVRSLAEGLRLTREAMQNAGNADVRHVLSIKEQQFEDAINAALAVRLEADIDPPLAGAPVPGQVFQLALDLRNYDPSMSIADPDASLEASPGWAVKYPTDRLIDDDGVHVGHSTRVQVRLAEDVPLSTRPYFNRRGLQESRYTQSDPVQFGRPVSQAPLVALGQYTIFGVPVEIREVVTRRESKAPYGEVLREVRTVPRLAVSLSPSHAILATGQRANGPTGQQEVPLEVTILHNAESATSGQVALRLPAGWTSEPASQPFDFARAGERSSYSFRVTPSAIDAKPYTIEAVATAAGKEYREGYELIDHRDLELRYLYRPSTAEVRGVNVTTVAGLKVGYVMGIGDSVPMGLQQLGAQVTLLDERALASADLSVYDTIMTGTRAYAVREDLKTYNPRLIDYVKAGGT